MPYIAHSSKTMFNKLMIRKAATILSLLLAITWRWTSLDFIHVVMGCCRLMVVMKEFSTRIREW